MPLTTACSSPEERARYHVERGREFADDGKDAAAAIEFLTAFSVDPNNLAALIELADVAEAREDRHDLRFYLREGLTLDPENDALAIRLAILLRDAEPLKARRLLLTVTARDEANFNAQLALSKNELSFRRIDEALRIVNVAIELEPGNPDAHWHRGIIYEAILKQGMLRGERVDEAVRNRAVDAFEAFVEVGGQPEWKARMEQARLLSTGSHNRAAALASALRALKSAREANEDAPKLTAARHLAGIARNQENSAAHAEATVALLEITPRDLRAWRQLAGLRESAGGSAHAVYSQLRTRYPANPEVHILFAQYLGKTKGYRAAASYIDEQIANGVNPPHLLSGLLTYQTSIYMRTQAARTFARLQREYPDSPWTTLELARKYALNAQTLPAIATLETLVQNAEMSEAFKLLAILQRFHHLTKRAIRSVTRAVELKGYVEPGLQELYVEILYEGGRFSKYLAELPKLERFSDLDAKQKQWKARALYETGEDSEGREILLELVRDPNAVVEATLEFARREVHDPKQQQLIRKLLTAAIADDPDNRDLIASLIYVNVESGRLKMASRMLEELAIEAYPAAIQDLRAHLRANRGDFAGARSDVHLALRSDPLLPTLIDFALFLYALDGPMDPHLDRVTSYIRRMRADTKNEWLVVSRRIAQLHLLRSRMLRYEGRNAEALGVLSFAIANHEYAIDSRIDHAYLVALTANNPDRAIEIASKIVAQHRSNPRALNTLGFAYLQAEKPFQALEFLRRANRTITSPNPRFLYQESIALRSMGRDREALELIEEVLALDPNFPEAAEDQRSLISTIDDETQDS